MHSVLLVFSGTKSPVVTGSLVGGTDRKPGPEVTGRCFADIGL